LSTDHRKGGGGEKEEEKEETGGFRRDILRLQGEKKGGKRRKKKRFIPQFPRRAYVVPVPVRGGKKGNFSYSVPSTLCNAHKQPFAQRA